MQRLCQHDFRMKERARDPRCDSDEITLSAKDFHMAGLREVGQVYGLSVANARSHFVDRGDRRQCRKQSARMNKEILGS